VKFYAINLIFILWRYNMTRTKSSRALLSVVLAVLMAAAFMPSLTYSSFAATAKKATKVTKLNHTGAKVYGKVGSKYTLKYKLSPKKLTSSAQKTVWKSSDSKIVKVIATKGKHATVKVKGVGTAKVTVTTKANPKAKATWTFKTKKAETETKTTLTGVTVSAPNAKDPAKEVKVGTELQASVAPTDAKDVTYQWYADGTEIKDATKAAFTVTTDQLGKTITVKVTSKNTVESAKTAAVTADEVKGTVIQKASVSGTTTTWAGLENTAPNVGDKLRALSYTDSADATAETGKTANITKDSVPSDVSSSVATYQWYRVGGKDVKGNDVATAISGATSSTYTVTKEDAGYTLRLVVTPKAGVKGMATDANGTTKTYNLGEVTTSNVNVALKVGTDAVADSNVYVGSTVSASVTPAAAASDVTYQWYAGATADAASAISGATSATYTPSVAGQYTVKVSLKQGESTWVLGTYTATFKANNKATKSVTATVVNQDAYDGTTGTVSTSNYLDNTLVVTAKGDRSATVAWYLKDVKGTDGKDIQLGTGDTYKIGTIPSGETKADGKALTKDDFIGKSVYAVVTGVNGEYKGSTATSKDFAVSATASKLTKINVGFGKDAGTDLTVDANKTVKVASGSVSAANGTDVVITLPSDVVTSATKITTQAANATVNGNVLTVAGVKTNDNITFTVDFDGDGNVYTPVTYTVDMSNVTRAL
jgi:hypothetical protein